MSLPRRKAPRHLIGDTAALRARFRDDHPDDRISTEPGSPYRTWLNAERRRHDRRLRGSRPKPKRLPGDNLLLRRAFIREHRLDVSDRNALGDSYRAWLTKHGIDPETGRMTEAGLAFFRSVLEQRTTPTEPERRPLH